MCYHRQEGIREGGLRASRASWRFLRPIAGAFLCVTLGFSSRAVADPPAPDAPPSSTTPTIQWETNYTAALAKAKQSAKPVMIDFYTDWCGWCKVLDKETYTDPRIIETAAQMISLKIDAEAEPELAQQYKVTGYPRIVFVSADGTTIDQINGYRPPDQFLPYMKAALAGSSLPQYVRSLIEKGTDDPREQMWVGMQLLDERKTSDALAYLEMALPHLDDPEKVSIQKVLPFVYLSQNQGEKAAAAFEAYRSNPKADRERVAEDDLRFSYLLKDRSRLERAVDVLIATTTNPKKKTAAEELRARIPEMFAEPGSGDTKQVSTDEAKAATAGNGNEE